MKGPCPCGSGKTSAACCAPLHRGVRAARTAEQLMRSRYSAFVERLEPYLLSSWHPDTRPPRLELAHDPTRWLGLQVRRVWAGGPGDERGVVSFTARSRVGTEDHVLTEDSRFVRLDGRWVYLDGEGGRPDWVISAPEGAATAADQPAALDS